MAFKNEKLTPEEQEEFKAKKIPNPGDRWHILELSWWTIDREKNMYLSWALQDREPPHDIYFFFNWKGIYVDMKLRKSWLDNDTCCWDMIELNIPKEVQPQKEQIVVDLKDALAVYAFDGTPDQPFNETTIVKFNF